MLLTVTNTPLVGAKNLIAPDASMEDGMLDVAVYPDMNKAELAAYFAKTANEGTPRDGAIRRYRARKIKIKSSPRLDVAAEGDIMLGKGSAKIKVLPGALQVLAPLPGQGAEKPLEAVAAAQPESVSPVASPPGLIGVLGDHGNGSSS